MQLMVTLPWEPEFFGIKPNVHLILEYLAFFVGFRYYVYLRKKTVDAISSNNRLSIIIGAVFGALVFSRIMAFLEDPIANYALGWVAFLNNKTIMGGLFGGLLGVELVKKMIGEKKSSGDLFTLPLIAGIFIGRLGCFFAGIKEFTYGRVTGFFMGMDLGDGIMRHPIVLYELIFLIFLFFNVHNLGEGKHCLKNGDLFKIFMVTYFAFRFFIEYLKPNAYLVLGLSSIQYLCLLCIFYYYPTLKKELANARKKIHLL